MVFGACSGSSRTGASGGSTSPAPAGSGGVATTATGGVVRSGGSNVGGGGSAGGSVSAGGSGSGGAIGSGGTSKTGGASALTPDAGPTSASDGAISSPASDGGSSLVTSISKDGVRQPLDNMLQRYTTMLEFSPTEFSRFRLQYAFDRSRTLNDVHKDVHEVLLQVNIAIGPHGAHSF